MSRRLEELLDSLLYEGYALYPYTPGAVKNAMPTPFGIVYPPAYAGASAATHDHLRLECTLEAPDGGRSCTPRSAFSSRAGRATRLSSAGLSCRPRRWPRSPATGSGRSSSSRARCG